MSKFCASRSVQNHEWREREDRGTIPTDLKTSKGILIPEEISRIALRRGASDVQKWIEPSLCDMPDPLILTNMDKAAERFCAAIERGEKIAILGDYDVDGATSTSILVRFMRMLDHHKLEFYIPQRLSEGYGPNIPAIEGLHERGAQLLIIADSGTMAFDPINRAVELGMDVLVLDHHEPKGHELPQAIVVNPKVDQEIYGKKDAPTYLCTAGLAFLFVAAVRRRFRENGYFDAKGVKQPNIMPLLGLVALGTVADVVPLKGLNRIYVACGLRYMKENPGIKALVEYCNKVIDEANAAAAAQAEAEGNADGSKAKIRPKQPVLYNAYACGFVIGPSLNAGGRIDDCMQGSTLLTTDDPAACEQLAARLHGLNRERQKMQEQMVTAAMAAVEEKGLKGNFVLAYDPTWHPGVIGLAASKLREQFDVPAIVIGKGGKGSGRSVKGFNLGKTFIEAYEAKMLSKGGGHAAAAGLTLIPECFEDFEAFLAERTRDLDSHRVPTNVDLVMPPGSLTVDMVEKFSLMEPFGMGNSKPRIAITGGVLMEARLVSNGVIRATLRGSDGLTTTAMVWQSAAQKIREGLLNSERHYVDILGSPSINEYGGRKSVQFTVEDVMVGEAA